MCNGQSRLIEFMYLNHDSWADLGCSTSTPCRSHLKSLIGKKRNLTENEADATDALSGNYLLQCTLIGQMAKIKLVERFRLKPRWVFVKITDEDDKVGWGEGTLGKLCP